MTIRWMFAVAIAALAALLIFSGIHAIAAANTVPPTNLGIWSTGIGINSFKPAACASLNLTTLIVSNGHGVTKGTAGNDLIFGTSGRDNIDGGAGDDCIVGGAGIDKIDGGTGNNICIRGSGSSTYTNCTVVNP